MSVTRFMLRWGLIGTLALGGATLLIGPERVAAGLYQVRTSAQDLVGQYVDDPVALRRQLQKLSDQYPDQIVEVRGEIAQVELQIDQFDHDVQIARRVVAMTTNDLNDLRQLVARAEKVQNTSGGRAVQVRYDSVRMDVDEALSEAKRIMGVRTSYQDRVSQDEHQLNFLAEQNQRLKEILAKLEDEYGSFQAQLWQLDRQIESIERNDRLIELTEQQQETLRSYEKFGRVGNFKQLQSKLAEIRAEQIARLDMLKSNWSRHGYEKEAEIAIESGDEVGSFDELFEMIDAEEIHQTPAPVTPTANSIAWSGPIVIE